MDAACPVQQLASVPCTRDGLNEKEESKLPEQPTEDGGHHNHEWWHHHKAKDDEGGAAVVVKVTADGRGGVEDLQGQIQRRSWEWRSPEDVRNSLTTAASFLSNSREGVCDWLAVICVSMCVSASARFRRGAMWVAGRDTFSSSLPLQFRYEVTEALSVTLGTVSQMCPRPQRRRGRRKAQKDVRDWERAKPGVPQWLPSYTRVKKACDTKDKHTSVCLSLEKSDAP